MAVVCITLGQVVVDIDCDVTDQTVNDALREYLQNIDIDNLGVHSWEILADEPQHDILCPCYDCYPEHVGDK